MAFQAHNLQAHAQQLEVESAHPVPSHINVGLQHQLDQVCIATACCWLTHAYCTSLLLTRYILQQSVSRCTPIICLRVHHFNL